MASDNEEDVRCVNAHDRCYEMSAGCPYCEPVEKPKTDPWTSFWNWAMKQIHPE